MTFTPLALWMFSLHYTNAAFYISELVDRLIAIRLPLVPRGFACVCFRKCALAPQSLPCPKREKLGAADSREAGFLSWKVAYVGCPTA